MDIACRCGDEEFAVFLPETVSAQAKVAAERLRKTVGAKAETDGNERILCRPTGGGGEMQMTVSVGVSS